MEDLMNVENVAGSAAAMVSVTEPTHGSRFTIRAGAEGRAAAEAAIGLALPMRIGERVVQGTRGALCLGPDEWVLHAGEVERDAIAAALSQAMGQVPFSALDISDREIALEIEGPAALDLLAAGCPLDLSRMPVGSGTRTVFDTAQVVLVREAGNRFRLEVWRSFAPHVRALLDIATREIAVGL
jgi:sarcosine oxidase subunit gamma